MPTDTHAPATPPPGAVPDPGGEAAAPPPAEVLTRRRGRVPWYRDEQRLRRWAWIGGLIAVVLVGIVVVGNGFLVGLERMVSSATAPWSDAATRKAAAAARVAEARREAGASERGGAAAILDPATGLTAGEAAMIAAEEYWELEAGTTWEPDRRLLWSRAVFAGDEVTPWNAADLPPSGAAHGEVTDLEVEESYETAAGVAVQVKLTTAPTTAPTADGSTDARVSPGHPTVVLERTPKGWKVLEIRTT